MPTLLPRTSSFRSKAGAIPRVPSIRPLELLAVEPPDGRTRRYGQLEIGVKFMSEWRG